LIQNNKKIALHISSIFFPKSPSPQE